MKVTIYLRVAKTDSKPKLSISHRPNYMPLSTQRHYKPDVSWPTISFGLNLNIPDSLFDEGDTIIGEVNIGKKQIEICNDIEVVKPK